MTKDSCVFASPRQNRPAYCSTHQQACEWEPEPWRKGGYVLRCPISGDIGMNAEKPESLRPYPGCGAILTFSPRTPVPSTKAGAGEAGIGIPEAEYGEIGDALNRPICARIASGGKRLC